jgi:dihydrofolate reductase
MERVAPLGRPGVRSHQPPTDWTDTDTPFTFIIDGVTAAIEQATTAAAGKNVGVGPGSTVDQALNAALINELRLDLVPTTLGAGVRLLEALDHAPQTFTDPQVIQGTGVTHLIYQLP